jgi:hypothetical protein
MPPENNFYTLPYEASHQAGSPNGTHPAFGPDFISELKAVVGN